MYVCVCHALKESDVRKAADEGCRNASDVHRHYGVETQCGRCERAMAEALEARNQDCLYAAAAS